jgi:hypothetical protein
VRHVRVLSDGWLTSLPLLLTATTGSIVAGLGV